MNQVILIYDCFTFLLYALVEKATRTLNQRNRLELCSPQGRADLPTFLFTLNWQVFRTSPFGPRAYMATLPMCTCLLYRGSVFIATRTTLLNRYVWRVWFKVAKEKARSYQVLDLCRAPCRVIWSLTTMSHMDPVSGSPLITNNQCHKSFQLSFVLREIIQCHPSFQLL